MAKVVATSRGYFGGVVREIGDQFSVPDDIWYDAKRRPSWAKLDPAKAFGGKGDHDGDGTVGGSKPADDNLGGSAPIVVPPDWQNLSVGEARKIASQIAGHEVKKVKDAHEIIAAFVEASKPAPFSDAPEPVQQTTAEAMKAIGANQPDWVAPGTPQPVTE